MGNDLVRFIATVFKRPVVTSGCSSGGVLSCWLSAYAMPHQLRGAVLEDPPLFASELTPIYGPSIPPDHRRPGLRADGEVSWRPMERRRLRQDERPPGAGLQNIKDHDPEWGRAFWEGTVAASCPHDRMLAGVKTPVPS